ncbi:MAG: M50 family metallopeptidase [Anaerolineae bacterium]|nr:M50 family metallopeptidase [Anaerolineae bacterium]MDW8101462.1 M50 family metallopeptidase [Anaerolineae bacterium]
MNWLILALLFLSLSIIAHELGHFILAKRNGVRVEEFGIGFPPRLIPLARWEETVFSLNAIPFGGFVKVVGEDDPSIEGGLASKPKGVRAKVLLAGAGMNLLLAFTLFTGAFMSGYPSPLYQVKVFGVAPGSPAEAAGIKPGDIILSANGVNFRTPEELSNYTDKHLGQEITLQIKRGEELFTVRLVPRPSPPAGEGPMGVKIGMAYVKKQASPFEALFLSAFSILRAVVLIITIPIQVISGLLPLAALRPVGPVGALQVMTDVAEQSSLMGWWFPFLFVSALLNVALAVSNLLPIPGLDGGRLLFVAFEAIKGHRIDPRRESWIHMIGVAILLILMLVITFFDIAAPLEEMEWDLF